MQISVELTMYPLQEDYIPVIRAFIEKLNEYRALKIQTVPTATIICGEFNQVMDCVKEMLSWSYQTQGKAVFVSKILPGYEAI